MPNYRRDRINEQMAHEMCEILREVKDPRISNNFVTVTAAEVTADLKFAKIFFSVLTKENADEINKEVKKGLESAKGFIRREVAHRLNLRITPELAFYPDNSMQIGAHISKMISEIEFSGDGDGKEEENRND
ncbi:MAG: 30S ribosome-binding factor RbfA [Clostridia bacterium]|nr:30S ribosome-binding factor RbfA [Clostridia bacterium]